MKRVFTNWTLLFCTMLTGSMAMAQQDWPKIISAANGDMIKIYQPQPESYSNNILKSRSAISIVESGKTDPVFGTFWSTAETAAAGDGRSVAIQSLQVTDLRFPTEMDDAKVNGIKSTLQSEVPRMNVRLSQEDLQNSLNANQEQSKLASTLNNNPPKVFYNNKPSMLVLIDGTPKLQMNNDWGVEAVVNTPFTIVKNNDGRFYLYGGKRWFTAPDATGPYSYVPSIPDNLQNVQAAIDKAAASSAAGANADNTTNSNTAGNGNTNAPDPSAAASDAIPQIVVSTEPAELIQSNGEPNFTPIEGTALLYVKNSGNDIFMNVNSQQYYVLLAGRWYKSDNLKSSWQYIPADQLPADFAKIPEGSPKDNVLASVAGTEAADDAVKDAQVPQTAKVDRKTATSSVTYDGNPQFENIDGTQMQYSVNSSNSVLRYQGRYYTVDNGVWFESGSAEGPWTVATSRPDEVDMIPPSYPVYNMKYVNVYDVNDDYVYDGYTPGYLNTYVYGPTIVYGTGYYYRPWYGRHFFPRAYTWGFNMGYNPWYGWSVGWDYGFGWFNCGFGFGGGWGGWGGWRGGWWGPAAYRPVPFYRPYGNYGFYGNRGYNYYNRAVFSARVYNNNIYNNRRGVVTVNNRTFVNNRTYINNRTINSTRTYGNNNFNRTNNAFQGGRTGNGFTNNNGGRTYRPAAQSPNGNFNNRVAARPNSAGPNPGRVQQQQYNRAPQQQQRTYNSVQQSRPAPQQHFERSGGGGGGARPSGGSGGGGGRSGGGGGGHSGGGRRG